MVMEFYRRRMFLVVLFSVSILASIIWYAKYWWTNVRIPSGWITYTNTEGYQYSFAHPKEWIVVECGAGGVILVKKRVDRCYFPLEASKEYLDNLYFQVFLSGHHSIINTANAKEFVLPNKLKNWTSSSWYWDFDWGGHYEWVGTAHGIIHVPPRGSNYHSHLSSSLSIGYIYDPARSMEFRKVLNSFRD